MKTFFLSLILLAALSGLAAPPATGQGRVVECGDVDRGVGIKNVTARGVTCARARALARKHPQDATPFGFRCKDREIARYTYDIRCTRGTKVVRWQYNSE